jgi:hypothetical protein
MDSGGFRVVWPLRLLVASDAAAREPRNLYVKSAFGRPSTHTCARQPLVGDGNEQAKAADQDVRLNCSRDGANPFLSAEFHPARCSPICEKFSCCEADGLGLSRERRGPLLSMSWGSIEGVLL